MGSGQYADVVLEDDVRELVGKPRDWDPADLEADTTPGITTPDSGHSDRNPTAVSTASMNASPRPSRCSSYQAAALSSSDAASDENRTGALNE